MSLCKEEWRRDGDERGHQASVDNIDDGSGDDMICPVFKV